MLEEYTNFQAFVDDIQKNQWNVFGVEIYQDGRLIHQYGDTTQRHTILFSCKKAA